MSTIATPFAPFTGIVLDIDDVRALHAILDTHPNRGVAEKLQSMLAEKSSALADETTRERIDAYIAGADTRDGEIEVDTGACVSMGADDGAYVQAWLWVSNEAAGLPNENDEEESEEDES